jgi:hypothetical protein
MEHFNPTGHPLNNAREITRLATCKRCGDDKLAWRKSAKTGRWYLCDVESCGRWATRENPTHRRYFELGMKPHRCP